MWSSSDGTPLAVTFDRGPRDPATAFVFLHGFGSVRTGEKATLLRERSRALGVSFLAFDARGHGESGGRFRDLTLSGTIADARAMIDGPAAECSRLVLVGSSFGGLAALHLAARHPERIAGCVALAPAFRLAERWLASIGEAAARRWQEEGTIRVHGEWVDADLGWEFIRDGLAQAEAELQDHLRVPTLIIHGRQDTTVPVALSVDFALGFPRPGLDLVVIGAGDHRLSAVKDQVQGLVEDFAARVAGIPRQ